MYTVEKGVEITETWKVKYPFYQMEVGDSFFHKGDSGNVRNAASAAGKRHNMRFSIRKEDDGVRVWRVA